MSRKLLLFGFEELPTILAAAAAAGPFGAEVVPVARQDYNKPLAVLAETTLGRGVRLEGERDERFHHEGRPWDRGVLGETLREIDGKKEGDSGAPFVF